VALRVGFGHECQVPARALARELEGEAMHALDAAAREGGDLHRHFVLQPGVHAAAGARVFALGVLAHDHPIDVAPAIERRLDARQHPRRPHIGVLIEALADRQAQAPERQVVGHVGRADRAKEDGIERLQALEAALGDVPAGLLEALGAPVEVLELEVEAGRRTLEHLDARRDHFVADTIAGNGRDSVGVHDVR